MRISKNWLKDFVDIPDKYSNRELSDLITTRVVEVDSVLSLGEELDKIVVGEIVKVEKHPDADKLKVCKVEITHSKLEIGGDVSIVCGGSNVREGMKVAVGLIGAKVRWHGEGDLVELKKVKIRGVESEGMICAADEIGLGDMFPKGDEKEILDLDKLESPIGTPLAKALGLDDVIFDIDNKSLSNRPDLWGHYGMAREVGVLTGKKLKQYPSFKIKEGKEIKVKVEIKNKNLCPRYTGAVIDGIKIKPSPQWLQNRLRAVGQRPINNIVDITNYVMFELGQPTHAFDASRLNKKTKKQENKKTIVVRRARKEEKFVTLDGIERRLTEDMLLITDGEKPIALAGVMGGRDSEVNDSTTSVFFESANFDAVLIRKMSATLGLRTEGSARWEKSLDPNNAELGLNRLVELTLKICPGARVASNVFDTGKVSLSGGPIEVSMDFLHKKIGVQIEKNRAIEILESLSFGVKEKKDVLRVTVPTWRATKDISIREDIAEEVSRIYGYKNIQAVLPRMPMDPPPRNTLRELEHKLKELLAYEHAYTEVFNYSFESAEWLHRIREDSSMHLELFNPVAKDRPLVRRHLIPNLIWSAERNMHRFDEIRLFEVGRCFHSEEKGEQTGKKDGSYLPKQVTYLGLMYAAKDNDKPYHVALSAVLGVFDRLGIEVKLQRAAESVDLVHPGRIAKITKDGTLLGYIGELHPLIQEKIGLPSRLAMVELNLEAVLDFWVEKVGYEPLPEYPAVDRDIAFLVDKDIAHAEVEKKLLTADNLIVKVKLFDVYDGKKIDSRKKSMAYHIIYQSPERTLESGEVDEAHQKAVKLLKDKFGAEIRK